MDDIDLMLRVKAGDWLSFAALMDRHRGNVERFLFNRLRDHSLAEEMAQETFLRVYRSRATYEPTARFKSWLYQIAAHLASNSRRDRRREKLHDSLDHHPTLAPPLQLRDRRPSAEDRLLAATTAEEVRRALASLPAKQRTAVVLHKYAELDYAEIATRFGCTPSAIKSLMFRAHESLRASLAHLNAA